ncbi:hypothetical protein N402_07265 [Helicobacter pylori FD423]|nr:hypothetical protein N402_07265 [Helicobacter pylori FD423]EQL66222.1 hypothetical protein N408_07865 [Helicobacter pylori FD703]EQL72772.1 hypothetical protein N409_07180 [Helicobacter pylori FD719]
MIVKNAFSVLDLYSFIPLVLLFISFVFNFLVGVYGVVFEWFLCFGFLEPI